MYHIIENESCTDFCYTSPLGSCDNTVIESFGFTVGGCSGTGNHNIYTLVMRYEKWYRTD